MKSVIVCVPRGVTIEEIYDQLVSSGIDVELWDGRLTVSARGSVAWVESDLEGELEREYEPNELARIAELIGDWEGFGIDYRTIGVANAVVAAICERWPCVVDDDDGFLGPAGEYLERYRAEGHTAQ
jgi:hypothetical protein